MSYEFTNETKLLADKYMKETIQNVLDYGYMDRDPRPKYKDGTPAHTLSVNQVVHRYDISKGEFPISTLRPTSVFMGIKEIICIYQKNIISLEEMRDNGVTWWDDWNIGDGTIGLRYGGTVEKYNLMDKLLYGIKTNPYSRRHIISLWQESDFEESPGLKPCAFCTMFNVRNDKYIDMTLIQRSSDWLVAGNINQIQYVAFMMMVCKATGYEPGVFVHFIQNLQIYDRHIENAKIMLNRKSIDLQPKLVLDTDKTDFYDFTADDFKLVDYKFSEVDKLNPNLTFELGI